MFMSKKSSRAFTLIELLVVIAMIAVLLAILVPVLGEAKEKMKCLRCQTNLRNIAIAWDMYLNDNKEYFYQRVNANHTFGGWQGAGDLTSYRPLNKYRGLDVEQCTQENAKKDFSCPSDQGDEVLYEGKAFHYFGNSYQTNEFLIGPNRYSPPADEGKQLYEEINKRLLNLKRAGVTQPPETLLLVGDNNWFHQWNKQDEFPAFWHGRPCHHNLAFLDSHVRLLPIHKNLWITGEYRVLPFKELNGMAMEIQYEIPQPQP
ncbi:MAG: type II secretion system protein [Sedimentisphaerales bacterium]|nr:type II secretion system protein [Sedimentisphaerales bacterium]